jgi:enamine deaminase RidA (YjgF/YER057c/UK114 family)
MAPSRKAIWVSSAPKPNGNYSHVVRESNTLHVAGWMGDDPATGKIVEGGIKAQIVHPASQSLYRQTALPRSFHGVDFG